MHRMQTSQNPSPYIRIFCGDGLASPLDLKLLLNPVAPADSDRCGSSDLGWRLSDIAHLESQVQLQPLPVTHIQFPFPFPLLFVRFSHTEREDAEGGKRRKGPTAGNTKEPLSVRTKTEEFHASTTQADPRDEEQNDVHAAVPISFNTPISNSVLLSIYFSGIAVFLAPAFSVKIVLMSQTIRFLNIHVPASGTKSSMYTTS